MALLPYGYKYSNGSIVVDQKQEARVKDLFNCFNSELSYQMAIKASGLEITHSQAKRMLSNTNYIGFGGYPSIVDEQVFHQAEENVRAREKSRKGRLGVRITKANAIGTAFSLGEVKQKYKDVIKQAQYIYSLIETEEKDGINC